MAAEHSLAAISGAQCTSWSSFPRSLSPSRPARHATGTPHRRSILCDRFGPATRIIRSSHPARCTSTGPTHTYTLSGIAATQSFDQHPAVLTSVTRPEPNTHFTRAIHTHEVSEHIFGSPTDDGKVIVYNMIILVCTHIILSRNSKYYYFYSRRFSLTYFFSSRVAYLYTSYVFFSRYPNRITFVFISVTICTHRCHPTRTQ